MPYPENLDNHYRLVGEDKLARTLAEEVLRAGTDFDGTERSPMRNAGARVTLGVTAAREGDLEQVLIMGERALEGDRQSVPSLIMTSRELAAEIAPSRRRKTLHDSTTWGVKSLGSCRRNRKQLR
ncbi:hypothetical protein [Streptomyces sp. NBC_01013]|uniref:hypothetical protein n=1 Tax=Streptomyces sp. NBC_01013 TaxID=2903718 RepID=UPI003869E985|nr:hypothetical protein OG538_19115 [Streptomyces sp. NBC_01013]